jgi:hypothetical protein
MKFPRVQFTVRRTIVALTAVSLALSGEKYRRMHATEKRRESWSTPKRQCATPSDADSAACRASG